MTGRKEEWGKEAADVPSQEVGKSSTRSVWCGFEKNVWGTRERQGKAVWTFPDYNAIII